jgi:hypothetical protein
LKTSVAKDGPINVTNPLHLFLIIFFMEMDQILLFRGFNPLATLTNTHLVLRSSMKDLIVLIIYFEGTAKIMYCGLKRSISNKSVVTKSGVATNFFVVKYLGFNLFLM